MVCRNDLRFILFIFPEWGMEAGCVCVCVCGVLLAPLILSFTPQMFLGTRAGPLAGCAPGRATLTEVPPPPRAPGCDVTSGGAGLSRETLTLPCPTSLRD